MYDQYLLDIILVGFFYHSINAKDHIQRLRICDPTVIINRVTFDDFPRCPSPVEFSNGSWAVHGGSVILFKPNAYQIHTKGYICREEIRESYEYTDFLGHTISQDNGKPRIIKRTVSSHVCRGWLETKTCKHGRLTRTGSVRGKPRWSYFPPLRRSGSWMKYTHTQTPSCFLEETDIWSQAPFDFIMYDSNKRINLPVGAFENGKGYSDRYIGLHWKPVLKSKVCDYVIDSIHTNVTVQNMDYDKSHFFIILHDAKRYIYIDPKKHMSDYSHWDHTYCMTQALKKRGSVASLYFTTSGEILAYIPPEVSMSSLHDYVKKSGVIISYNLLPFQETVEDESKTMNSGKVTSNANDHPVHPSIDLPNAGWLIGLQKNIETVRYFVQKTMRDWTVSQAKRDFEAWCNEALYRQTQARIQARMSPSDVLSVWLNMDVFARLRGDLYEISPCRYLKVAEYKIFPFLNVSRQHGVCFSRPLIEYIDAQTGSKMYGQISHDQRVVTPAVFTEDCDEGAEHFFFIEGDLYVFQNYLLVNTTDSGDNSTATNRANGAFTILGLQSKNRPHIVPPISEEVPLFKPTYNVTELAQSLDFMDMALKNNYQRLADKERQRLERNSIDLHDGPRADALLEVAVGLGSGVSKAVGALARFVSGIFTSIGEWMKDNIGALFFLLAFFIVCTGGFGYFIHMICRLFQSIKKGTKYRQFKYRSKQKTRNPPILADTTDASAIQTFFRHMRQKSQDKSKTRKAKIKCKSQISSSGSDSSTGIESLEERLLSRK